MTPPSACLFWWPDQEPYPARVQPLLHRVSGQRSQRCASHVADVEHGLLCSAALQPAELTDELADSPFPLPVLADDGRGIAAGVDRGCVKTLRSMGTRRVEFVRFVAV